MPKFLVRIYFFIGVAFIRVHLPASQARPGIRLRRSQWRTGKARRPGPYSSVKIIIILT